MTTIGVTFLYFSTDAKTFLFVSKAFYQQNGFCLEKCSILILKLI